ncbi:MAG: peptide chain release factor N(5)-glutamine methyltransferase [Betaproteobacteria bacterium]|nr:peptide chain release factor N(5)-glutamine methyltransferase [Betaproteobacteria bacterium]
MRSTIAEALALASAKIDRFEAQYLLADLLKVGRAALIAHPDQALDARELGIYQSQVAARAKGKPVAYILGRREFYGRDFLVNEQVLIPRPETETLIEQVLARLEGISGTAEILDLGTGSGAIAVTLQLEVPDARVTAVEKSRRALDVARQNAERLGAPVRFVESDWYSHVAGERFHLIAANPPYVAGADPHLDQGDLRFEPRGALTDDIAGGDGLGSIRHIVEHAPSYLHAGGWLLCEHGWDQAGACRDLLTARGFTEVKSAVDLAGIERIAIGRWLG